MTLNSWEAASLSAIVNCTRITRFAYRSQNRKKICLVIGAGLPCNRETASDANGLGLDLQKYVHAGSLIVRQLDPAELSIGDFVQQIRTAVEDRQLCLMVLDSINGFLNAMPGEHFLMSQLHELLSYLNEHGV